MKIQTFVACLLMPMVILSGLLQKPTLASPNEPVTNNVVFDNTVKSLPRNFGGHDAVLIMQKSKELEEEGKIKPRSEFDKSSAYSRRVSRAVAQAMHMKGKWTDSSLFAANISRNEIGIRYDAEKEVLQVSSGVGIIGVYSSIDSVELQSHPEDRILLQIGRSDIEQFPSIEGKADHAASVFLKMPSARAKVVKQAMRVLVLFRLYALGGTDSGELLSNIREVWYYNGYTGQIYYKALSSG